MNKGGSQKGLIIEIDRAAVRAFVFLGLLIGGSWSIFNATRLKADISETLSTAFTNSATNTSSQIEVKPDGSIFIDGLPTTETVQRTTDADEVRLKLIDGETEFVPRLDVVLKLPTPLKTDNKKLTYDILAVHGANRQRPTLIDNQTIRYVATEIEPEATVTIVAQMNRGALNLGPKATLKSLATSIEPYWWWLIGLLMPAVTYFFTIKRKLKFQSTSNQSIIAGPPSNLSPAAVGLLVNERAGHEQLAATLTAMACRGDIQIVQTRNGYRIARRRALEQLLPIEKFLIDELRIQIGPIGQQEVIENELKKKLFSQKITSAFVSIFAELEQRGFFASDSTKKRSGIKFRGLVLIILSIFGAILISLTIPSGALLTPVFVGVFLSGWVILSKASQIPLLTSVGESERERWVAFRELLSANKPMPGGQDNVKYFFNWLPYAIALKVADQWIHRFNPDFITIPEWYFNEDNPSSTETFLGDITDITTDISQTLTKVAIPQT